MQLRSCIGVLLCLISGIAQADGLLYAGKPVARDGTDALVPRIQDQISRSLERPAAGSRLSGFDSYWSMRDRVSGFGPELVDLGRYAGRDYGDSLGGLYSQLRKLKVAEVLRIEVYRPAPSKLSIRLDVFGLPKDPKEPWKHIEAKWIAPCGLPDEQVLDQLGDAARCIGRGSCTRPPTAVIDVLPSTEIGVDQELTLDGCASYDVDHDALEWQWSRDGSTEVTTTGRRWTMRFREPGTHTFTLGVRPEVGDGRGEATVTVHVSKQPVANAGPDQRFEPTSTSTKLSLDGSASRDATSYRWDQVGGPLGRFVVETPGIGQGLSCETALCAYEPTGPGAYTFRLTVRNGAMSATDDVVVLIDPRIRVAISSGGLRRMFPSNSIKLSTSIGADDIDGTPSIRWTTPEGAVLTAPSERQTQFIPALPGHYVIVAEVGGRKKIGDRELWVTGRDELEIDVRHPNAFAGIMVDAVRDSAGITFVPSLNLLTRLFDRAPTFRASVGLGAYNPRRGGTPDFAFGLDVGVAGAPNNTWQTFLQVGVRTVPRELQAASENAVRLSITHLIGTLRRFGLALEVSSALVFGEDQRFQAGFALGIFRPFGLSSGE